MCCIQQHRQRRCKLSSPSVRHTHPMRLPLPLHPPAHAHAHYGRSHYRIPSISSNSSSSRSAGSVCHIPCKLRCVHERCSSVDVIELCIMQLQQVCNIFWKAALLDEKRQLPGVQGATGLWQRSCASAAGLRSCCRAAVVCRAPVRHSRNKGM